MFFNLQLAPLLLMSNQSNSVFEECDSSFCNRFVTEEVSRAS
jgi:hypothetical protein